MHRSFLPTLLLALIATLTITTPAQAATSTCSTHQATILGWNIQDNTITGHYDFQCGGANNDPWRITYSIQYQDTSTWVTPICANGQSCAATRPTPGNPPFAGGSEHSSNFEFSPLVPVNCNHTWRVHAHVAFSSGSVFNTNGPFQTITGC